jgi:serine/threonine-protein phosphatase 6 regulatory subunit 3
LSRTTIFHISAISDILEKDDFSLEELLQEDELLQEVKSRNGKLIE